MPRSKIKATDEVIDEELKKATKTTKRQSTSKKKDNEEVKKTSTRKSATKSTTKSTAKSTSKLTKKDSSETKAKSTTDSKSKKSEDIVVPAEEKKKTTRKTTTKKTAVSKKTIPVDDVIDIEKELDNSETNIVEEKIAKKTTRKTATKKSDDSSTNSTAKKSTTTTKTRTKKADKEEPIVDDEIVEEKPVKKTTRKSTAKKASSATKSTTKKTTSTAKKSTASKSTTKSTTKKTTTRKSSVPKKVSSTKSVEIDLESDELLEDKFENIVEYYDLPYRYNQTVVKLLAQDPTTLFVYWDVSDEDISNFQKKYGENFFSNTIPVLLVHNITHNYTFEVEINDFANNWYIHVNDSKCSYSVELCRKVIEHSNDYDAHYIENLINVSYSNTIEIPNDHILFFKDNDKIYFKNIKTNKVTEMVYKSASHENNLKAIYSDYELSQDEDRFDFKNPSSQNPTSNVM